MLGARRPTPGTTGSSRPRPDATPRRVLPREKGHKSRGRAPRRRPLHPHQQGRQELPPGHGAALRSVARPAGSPSSTTAPTCCSRSWSCSATSWWCRRRRRASTGCAPARSPAASGGRSPSPSRSTAPPRAGTPEFDSRQLRYSYQSLVTPPSVFDFDMAAGGSTLLKREEVLGGFDPRALRLRAAVGHGPRRHQGADQHRVPEGFVRDGKAPLWLNGYGSYGFGLPASFDSGG